MHRDYCFIISSMRSGSTLLKALIATRPDCSDLPETPFENYDSVESDKKIIVIKKPAGYHDFEYPDLNDLKAKKIILIRNPYDTVCSLQKMNMATMQKNSQINDPVYLFSYWYMVYNNIIEKQLLKTDNTLLLRYEDLIKDPIKETSNVFKFIGTNFQTGTETYSTPINYNWQWRKDDGGEVIKTLNVQKTPKNHINQDLLSFINNSPKIQFVLSYFGYEKTQMY